MQDLAALVERHQHRIYGFALALTGNHHDAEDVAQEAFIRAHSALGGYSDERRAALKESAWLHRIALNVFRNRRRAEKARPTLPIDAVAEPAADGLGPERANELRQALARLPKRYREAVVLRHVQGLTYEEIARVMDVPAGTLKSDVHRGLRLLKEELDGADR
jgi:RNA polymerase sigma-70 factor, ECF subfamily